MFIDVALVILIFSPLLGFLSNSFIRWKRSVASALGCGAALISFLSACFIFISFLFEKNSQTITLFPWIQWEKLSVQFSFLIDPLSLIMMSVITGVGFLIHLFSLDYMKNDPRIGRYFSYLNLFIFSMLVLVLADNLLLMFVGWEGVGLCSYLLIGFWFNKKEKAVAGMKAFIANRIGDAAFLVGMFLFFYLFGSLDFSALSSGNINHSSFLITATCLFLFIGATGKSAQIPLYVWLPSAMAGPTPVSALIHAATMVTAGIYLIIRTQALWLASSSVALLVVGIVGVATCLLGAFLACKAWDVKKILAYSTMSQLGYMFLALGVGAFSSALFHLVTHAFFKAGLFLAAGSLIHGLHGEQDIRNMGGLRKKMPYTFITFLIGGLALMGVFPLSGFFSKDEILYNAFHNGFFILWAVALLGVALTAFYTTKALYFIFWKKPDKNHDEVHECGWWARAPLIVLSFLGLSAGILNWPHFLPGPHQWLKKWLGEKESLPDIMTEVVLAGASSFLVISVACVSFWFLTQNRQIKFLSYIFKFNWSLDSFYQKYFVEMTYKLSQALLHYFETLVLRKAISSLSHYVLVLRKIFIFFQNGQIRDYLVFMVLGVLIFTFVTMVG